MGGVVGVVAVPAELIDEAAPWKIVGVEIWCVLFGEQPGLLPCRGVGVVGDGVSSEGVSERFGFTSIFLVWQSTPAMPTLVESSPSTVLK